MAVKPTARTGRRTAHGPVEVIGMHLRDAIAACAGDDRPAHTYLTFTGEPGPTLTRAALHRRVSELAAGLAAHGVRPGDRVALVADEVAGFSSTFLAAIWLGAVPVPLPPPPPIGRSAPWLRDVGNRLELARPALTAASPAGAGQIAGAVPFDSLLGHGTRAAPTVSPAGAPIYLQFTSGSTGAPRAVVVTGESLAANCTAIAAGLGLSPADVGVSWLPLHHDMGLVGFVCAALTAAVPVVLLPTAAFVRDPGVWMRTVSTHRGTVTFGPGFAFGLAARRAGSGVRELDLSGLRILGCGGEPIRPDGVRRFLDVHGAAGLRPESFTPSYGLAEFTLAVSFGRGLVVEDGAVDCGPVVPGHEVRVRADGQIWLRGPSTTAGYLDGPFRPGDWLRTGDRGRLRSGHLFVTGRQKDVLIIRGVNLDPQRVEWTVADVPGVQEGGAVAFTRPGADTEELVLVVECRPEAPPQVVEDVRHAVTTEFALTPADLVRVPPRTIPKTTSGKPRRGETRRRYLAGELP
jgi:acyl-CoA synthetase (AMP-forming)/AMP-acid ligase II